METAVAIRMIELVTTEQPPKSIPYLAAFNDADEFIAVVPGSSITHSAIMQHLNYISIESNVKLDVRMIGAWNNELSSIIQVELDKPMEPTSGINMAYWFMNNMAEGELHILVGVMAYHRSSNNGNERVFILSPIPSKRITVDHDKVITDTITESGNTWSDYIIPWINMLRHPEWLPQTFLRMLESSPIGATHIREARNEFEFTSGYTSWDMLVTLSSIFDRMQRGNIYRRYDLRRRSNGPIKQELKERINNGNEAES